MLPVIQGLFSLFYSPRRPKRKFIWPKIDYHPIHGFPGKVDRPKLRINTVFPSQPKFLSQLSGPLDRHIVAKPIYQRAWEQRKTKSYYNVDMVTQISKHSYRPIQEKRYTFRSGGKISSRSQPHQRTKNTFYDTIIEERIPRF